MKHENLWVMCAAFGATSAVLAGPAPAQQRTPSATIVGERSVEQGLTQYVSYRDLNLASLKGERMLKRRVGQAARTVCEPNGNGVSDLVFANCVAYAWRGARPQIDRAVHRAREMAATGSSSIPMVAITISAQR